MECRLCDCIEFGHTRNRLIVGEVVVFHLRDGLVTDGKVATRALDPIARLAGQNHARLGEIVTMAALHEAKKT
jgi:flavin reductase (DIM6/NTAB) family NADH-FMN oxidoreductase RutF